MADTIAALLKPLAIPYISDASTLRVTLLYFVKNQYKILPYIFYWVLLPFGSLLANISTKPIYKLRSRLLANNLLTKTISLAIVRSRGMYLSPQARLSIYHPSRLFSLVQFSSRGN
jgi:hypothetical protein